MAEGIDPEQRRLLFKEGKPVSLNSKTFDLLLALIMKRGEILSKDELLETVWAGQFVEEGNLTVHISTLRKILGEKKDENRFIITVPGRKATVKFRPHIVGSAVITATVSFQGGTRTVSREIMVSR